MSKLIVTTSWDDGHKLDVRLAALLKKYNIQGTFYVSPKSREFGAEDLLNESQIKELSESFEIGAHTITHPRLIDIPDEEAKNEIAESKRYLENITGKPVVSFCYPCGKYKSRHVKMVRDAGFSYARTVRRFARGSGARFEASTTVNTYNHYQDLWKIAKFARFNPFKIYKYFHWDELAVAMFDRMKETGGVFHLWGHSWEVPAKRSN